MVIKYDTGFPYESRYYSLDALDLFLGILTIFETFLPNPSEHAQTSCSCALGQKDAKLMIVTFTLRIF